MKGYAVVQEFLAKADITSKGVQKALGIKGKAAQIFWALLNAAGDNLSILDASKVAAKLDKYSAPLLTRLRKAGLIERGDGVGKWSISSKAVKKMKAALEGDTTESQLHGRKLAPKKVKKVRKRKKRSTHQTPKKVVRLKKTAKKKRKKARSSQAKRFKGMLVSELLEKLRLKAEGLTSRIEQLTAKRDGVNLNIAAIKDALK